MQKNQFLIYFRNLKHLLRNVLDPQSASNTTAQLQRKRNYSDEIQRYDFFPSAKAPNWACNEQEDIVYDTEFVQTEGEDELSFVSTSTKAPNWACNEQEDIVYDTEFVQTEGEDELSFVSTSSSKISAEQ
ncbi:hypothetical protein Glove_149g71 [Diversispora epigaea]|uniref:Uncharacterized protein n=1 Tax=Diversispora epigaea TaxID=1348612 RepID=A0A397J264_9GLOM|nr:hypothetical protein Glove_149g71 [Diversispora epigaea]